jgi:predicted 2-oxoglutarate/Fe(II)-dependent dioxygenase YbiX
MGSGPVDVARPRHAVVTYEVNRNLSIRFNGRPVALIRDDAKRTLLFDLDASIQQLNRENADHPVGVQLTGVYHNLLQWAEV